MKINENFEKLPENYLFSEVAKKLHEFRQKNPSAEIIRMDIGDVTLPIPPVAIESMHEAVDEMAETKTFHGYGPEQGYDFLRNAISEGDYKSRDIDISADEIFISDGAKSDLGNLEDIFSSDAKIAIADPGYPVYLDTAVMSGRAGELKDGKWSDIVYLECDANNGFKPIPPKEHADVVILCSPNNPTGVAFTKEDLRRWIEYAKRESALIIYDSAYEAYVSDVAYPRSIYEIEGAKEVAIEVRSFSKTAGFTGLRCGYTVVPKVLTGTDCSGNPVSLRKLWNRRQTTKFNGASYIVQKGAAALYTPQGKEQVRECVEYYLENAKIIRECLEKAGYEVHGGEHSPYIWVKSKNNLDSWQLFDYILGQKHISCTPGIGFGKNGNGYIRFTGFNSRENTLKAMKRFLN